MLSRISTIKELFGFLWKRKLWWLMPVIVVLLIIAGIILFIGSSPLAPIIYPLF